MGRRVERAGRGEVEGKGEGRRGEGERGRWQREMKMEVAGGIEARQRGQTTVDSYHLCTVKPIFSAVLHARLRIAQVNIVYSKQTHICQ